jgi:hypothetical protein
VIERLESRGAATRFVAISVFHVIDVMALIQQTLLFSTPGNADVAAPRLNIFSLPIASQR